MIPLILYLSVRTGEYVLNQEVDISFNKLLSIQTLSNLYVYTIGATVLSIIAAIAGFIITWLLLTVFGYKPKTDE